MGRKALLIKESEQLLAQMRFDAPNTRRRRRLEIRHFINELVRLGIAPPKLSNINQTHIKQCVDYWKDKSLAPITIMNKLSIIRSFLKLPNGSIPKNREFGLHYDPKEKSPLPSIDILSNFETSLVRTIVAFQLYFGLTKMESIRINLNYAIRDSFLFIDRAIASNKKDRAIPILTAEQEKTIDDRKKFLRGREKITERLSEIDTVALYKAELQLNDLDPHLDFRKYYTKERFQKLIKSNSELSTLEQLQREIGLSSKYKFKELL